MLNKILSNSLGDFLRARGGNFEKSVWTKSLIVDLAALAGKTGHTGRDHVRGVFERLASETQHQSGCGEVLRGSLVDCESKNGHFGKGDCFSCFPTYLLVPINYEEAEGVNYRILLQITQVGVREGVVE